MPVRVLFVNHVSQASGAERTLADLLAHLPGDLEPLVACPGPEDGWLPRALGSLGVPWHRIRAWRPHRVPWWRAWADGTAFLPAVGSLRAVLARTRPAVIHCNSLPAALMTFGCGTRAPVVWHARDLRLPEAMAARVLRRSTRVVAISRCVREALCHLVPESAAKVQVVYNGVAVPDPEGTGGRPPLRRELGLSGGEPLIGTLAQVVPWKRLEVLIEAAQALGEEQKAHFVVGGADLFDEHRGYAAQLRALCARAGLTDRVHWLGWREDAAAILASLTAYLHTAAEEPLGRAILEAMAVGTPCVAPAACGPAEILRHGDTGLLYQPGDGADAARALRRVIRDPAFAEHLGVAARRDFQERFTAERMAAEMAGVYRALVV